MMPRSGFFIVAIVFLWHAMACTQTFDAFIGSLNAASAGVERERLIDDFLATHPVPVTEGNRVHFLYRGKAEAVAVPGELNGWNPSRAPMRRMPGTDLFYRSDSAPINGRIEYKLWVDNVWRLDPMNARTALGGFGENSELPMPQYHAPEVMPSTPAWPRGSLDTQWITSASLHRRHPVYVYLPAGAPKRELLPAIYLTDGGEYLSLGGTAATLDRLIGTGRMRPVAGVFVDPRTDPADHATNRRMTDYVASRPFLDFLEQEVAPFVEKKYGISGKPEERAVVGASLGGLIATYAVLARPGFANMCGAQSPSYFHADSAVIKLLDSLRSVGGTFCIQSGTIGDTQVEARLVSRSLRERGAQLFYEEFPEGHNWTNWRVHLARIFEHFFPPR